MTCKTKRPALQFNGMVGEEAEERVFLAAQKIVKGLTFVGIASDIRGCIAVLQRGGKEFVLESLQITLANELEIPYYDIKVIKPPTGANNLTNVTWSRSKGSLKMAGRPKLTQMQKDKIDQEMIPFNPSMIPTEEDASPEKAARTPDEVCIQDHLKNPEHQCKEDCPGKTQDLDYTVPENEGWEGALDYMNYM